MNPITRLMKSVIKMPLKKALPLLFIFSILLVSIMGCISTTYTNNTNTSSAKTKTYTSSNTIITKTKTKTISAVATATPIATSTPQTPAGFDPLLAKMILTLKAEYGSNMVTWRAKDDKISFDAVFVNFDSHGRGTTAEIRNAGSIDEASRLFRILSTPGPGSGRILDVGSNTYFGQQAATVALGHAPTVVDDAYIKTISGNLVGIDNEYIQYDQLFINIVSMPQEE